MASATNQGPRESLHNEDIAASPSLSQTPGNKSSFRRVRSRAARACEVCHSRKVRCDVVTHQPCTNCIAFGCECRVPESRNRRNDARRVKTESDAENTSDAGAASKQRRPRKQTKEPASQTAANRSSTPASHAAAAAAPSVTAAQGQGQGLGQSLGQAHGQAHGNYGQLTPGSGSGSAHGTPSSIPHVSPSGSSVSIGGGPDRKVFFGASSHVTLLLHHSKLSDDPPSNDDDSEVIQVPLKVRDVVMSDDDNDSDGNGNEDHHKAKTVRRAAIAGPSISDSDRAALAIKGAFTLPPKAIADELVADYFTYIHPYVPVLDKEQFLAEYNSPNEDDWPSLMLRQAVFCAGARVSMSPALMDSGSTVEACRTFYQRCKALFDSDYEEDPYVNIQTAILFATALDNPTLMKHGIYYWTRVAITMAQGVGLHRRIASEPSNPRASILRRMWWALYVRDVSSAVSYGRPMMINLEDSDVDMVTLADFSDSDNVLHAEYFIYSVRLHEITALVARQQYSVGAERLRRLDQLPDASQCDLALANWANTLPAVLRYSLKDPGRHEFFRALLYLQYYTVLCLAHRPQVVQLASSNRRDSRAQRYPSWGIAFQAGHMIVRILENLCKSGEIRRLPAVGIYTCFSALLMLSYQRESPQPSVVAAAQHALASLIDTIKELTKNAQTAEWILMMARSLRDSGAVRGRLTRALKRQHESGEASGDATDRSSTEQTQAPSSLDDYEYPSKQRRAAGPPEFQPAPDQLPSAQYTQHIPQQPPIPTQLPQQQPQFSQGPVDLDPNSVRQPAPLASDAQQSQQFLGVPPAAHGEDLFLATGGRSLPPTPAVTDALKLEELFPEGDAGLEDDHRGLETGGGLLFNGDLDIHGQSSSDEGVSSGYQAPYSLGMGDWYDFLMS